MMLIELNGISGNNVVLSVHAIEAFYEISKEETEVIGDQWTFRVKDSIKTIRELIDVAELRQIRKNKELAAMI